MWISPVFNNIFSVNILVLNGLNRLWTKCLDSMDFGLHVILNKFPKPNSYDHRNHRSITDAKLFLKPLLKQA